MDPDGKVVARASAPSSAQAGDLEQTLRVAAPRLWSPDSPHLYRLRTSLLDGDRAADSLEVPLGFRWFRFDAAQGFFLNGKRVQLRGTTWHQSYPGMGDALPNSRHFADMKVIREMGCNFFRTSHYPHDPAVIEACDRLGLLVLEELFVGEEIEDTPQYYEIQAKTAEEMIVRDRNNPCVILWGMEGEIDAAPKSARTVTALVERLRELDPTRLVTMQDARVEEIKTHLDVVGLYSEFEDDDRDHRRHPTRSYLIEEYSAAGIGRGVYGMGPESEDLGCVKHEEYLSQVNLRPWIAGSALWHQFDYDGEEYDPVIPHLVTFGMADAWRIPKDVYYFYQSQWSAEPMVHICGHWTWPGQEGKTRAVKIYSNLDEVELLLNGRSLGVKPRGTYPGLEHPPRVWDVAYEPGVLEAVAHRGSRQLGDRRKTAGPPAGIHLRPDVDRVVSGDRESLAYLTASVVDKDGTVVPTAYDAINFSCYGPGELLPQTWPGHTTGFTWNAVAGMTVVAFRARTASDGRSSARTRQGSAWDASTSTWSRSANETRWNTAAVPPCIADSERRDSLMTRRDFISTATVAALAAAFSEHASAQGAGKLKLAIVGTGERGALDWGRPIAQDFRDVVQLVALCDINGKRAAAARELIGTDAPAFTDFDEAIRLSKPDAVLVTTVDATHWRYMTRAMDLGVDVICEKPLCTDERQCQAVLDAQKRTGRKVTVAFNARHAADAKKVKQLLMEKAVGDVVSVDFHEYLNTSHGADYFRRWHHLRENSGTLLCHKASHHFDLANWWLDAQPVEVSAWGDLKFYGRNNSFRGTHCRKCPFDSQCSFRWDVLTNADYKKLYVDCNARVK